MCLNSQDKLHRQPATFRSCKRLQTYRRSQNQQARQTDALELWSTSVSSGRLQFVVLHYASISITNVHGWVT
jgi:hypothetical protein